VRRIELLGPMGAGKSTLYKRIRRQSKMHLQSEDFATARDNEYMVTVQPDGSRWGTGSLRRCATMARSR